MPPTFAFPDDLRFTCSRCGDCCRTWDVLVSPEERQALEQLDWNDVAQDLVKISPTLSAGEGQRRLRRRDDGACIYLGEQEQCRLHEHFGAEAKPLMCRLYPFGFYPLGDRVGVDVAFSCSAVSRGEGAALDGRVSEWARLVAETVGEAGDEGTLDRRRHELRPATELPAAVLWQLEHDLMSFLSDRDMALFDRVRCILQYTRIATTGDPTQPTAAALRRAMAAGIPKQMQREASQESLDKTQRAVFFQWLFLALNPGSIASRELDRGAFERERKRRLKLVERYRVREAQPWIGERELGATYGEVAAVGSGVLREPGGEAPPGLLERYLRAKILGQRFLVHDGHELPFVEAVQRFFLVYPMALWTAKALAAERAKTSERKPEVEEGDLRAALRLVDRTLGRLPFFSLGKKEARASNFVILETPVVEAAAADLLHGRL